MSGSRGNSRNASQAQRGWLCFCLFLPRSLPLVPAFPSVSLHVTILTTSLTPCLFLERSYSAKGESALFACLAALKLISSRYPFSSACLLSQDILPSLLLSRLSTVISPCPQPSDKAAGSLGDQGTTQALGSRKQRVSDLEQTARLCLSFEAKESHYE